MMKKITLKLNKNGDNYIGEHKDYMPHGQGTYTYPDGAVYVGEFKDGFMHGQGTFIYVDGTTEFCEI
tara:strand:+ start:12 stop:212 length:201 start_codon:yes stop_codon:yes gene_type:complete